MNPENKTTVLSCLFISLFSIALVFLYFVSPSASREQTIAFLADGRYSDFLQNGFVVFSFGIRNLEDSNQEYEIKYFLEGTVLGKEKVFVEKGKQEVFSRAIASGITEPLLPLKFTVRIRNQEGKETLLWFWLTKNQAK